jgi:hypothetical protein
MGGVTREGGAQRGAVQAAEPGSASHGLGGGAVRGGGRMGSMDSWPARPAAFSGPRPPAEVGTSMRQRETAD